MDSTPEYNLPLSVLYPLTVPECCLPLSRDSDGFSSMSALTSVDSKQCQLFVFFVLEVLGLAQYASWPNPDVSVPRHKQPCKPLFISLNCLSKPPSRGDVGIHTTFEEGSTLGDIAHALRESGWCAVLVGYISERSSHSGLLME